MNDARCRPGFGRMGCALVLSSLAATALGAQEARGRVTDAASGEPIATAFVLLLDADGSRETATLSGPDGSFRLGPVAPGTYRIGVERIGYQTYESEPVRLTVGEIEEMDLRVSTAAIVLDGIVAEADRRCTVRPGEGLRASRLWDEARKALDVASWTEAAGGAAFRTRLYERVRDLHSMRVLDEHARGRAVYGASPFRSASAEALAEHGYVRRLPDGSHQYFGLDAKSLLSDAFLDTHCFRVRDPDASAPLIGLAFQPIPGRRLPDISGVLWLDRETGELRHLEFTYTRHLHPIDVPSGAFGGRVEFARLENGAWIVERWWIRMPQVQSALFVNEIGDDGRHRGIRVLEVGGEVERIGGAAW